jgi:hypothetical protein
MRSTGMNLRISLALHFAATGVTCGTLLPKVKEGDAASAPRSPAVQVENIIHNPVNSDRIADYLTRILGVV